LQPWGSMLRIAPERRLLSRIARHDAICSNPHLWLAVAKNSAAKPELS
jgi:hypothetical protein